MLKLKNLVRKIKRNKRIVILSILFGLFYIGLFFLFRDRGITKEEIQEIIKPFGSYGLVAMLLLQIGFSMTPLPDSAMPLLAMIIYGPLGVFVVMFGMLIASIINYTIGKHLGKAVILKKFPEIEKYLNKIGENNIILKLVALRIFTFVSFDITSYVAGISRIKFNKFLIAAVLGLIPANMILILIGYGLFAKSQADIIVTWGAIFILAIILFVFYKKNSIK
jgi:uncharacterized membrane protein YdjX (TVP38/TMEM64 family)